MVAFYFYFFVVCVYAFPLAVWICFAVLCGVYFCWALAYMNCTHVNFFQFIYLTERQKGRTSILWRALYNAFLTRWWKVSCAFCLLFLLYVLEFPLIIFWHLLLCTYVIYFVPQPSPAVTKNIINSSFLVPHKPYLLHYCTLIYFKLNYLSISHLHHK